jgi:hypothetical protein
MVSLEPATWTDPYVHVGVPGTFTWQKWDNWGNHHMNSIYMAMVMYNHYWDMIRWGDRVYPE